MTAATDLSDDDELAAIGGAVEALSKIEHDRPRLTRAMKWLYARFLNAPEKRRLTGGAEDYGLREGS
jgi:hypothetical protein